MHGFVKRQNKRSLFNSISIRFNCNQNYFFMVNVRVTTYYCTSLFPPLVHFEATLFRHPVDPTPFLSNIWASITNRIKFNIFYIIKLLFYIEKKLDQVIHQESVACNKQRCQRRFFGTSSIDLLRFFPNEGRRPRMVTLATATDSDPPTLALFSQNVRKAKLLPSVGRCGCICMWENVFLAISDHETLWKALNSHTMSDVIVPYHVNTNNKTNFKHNGQ